VKFSLNLGGGLKRRLWTHLLQNELEQAAFVFAKARVRDASTTFSAKDVYLIPPEDFDVQTGYHIELADGVRGRVIKQAWDTDTVLIEFHSHPGDTKPAIFSGSDLSGFDEFVPHCRWRLRGRPYVAVLVNAVGVDALAWAGDGQSPAPLETVRTGWLRKIAPTNRTIFASQAGGSKHGR
jgi:hypothetical protein